MVKVRFVGSAEDTVEVEATVGEPLMFSLRDQNMGLEAICGGALACATCHIYVDQDLFDQLPPISDHEESLLDGLISRQPNSRLSCQVEVSDQLEGAVVRLGGSE